MICPSGRRRARAKLGGVCLLRLVFSDRGQIHVLAFGPSAGDRRSNAISVQVSSDRCKRMVRQEKVLRWDSEKRLVADCFDELEGKR